MAEIKNNQKKFIDRLLEMLVFLALVGLSLYNVFSEHRLQVILGVIVAICAGGYFESKVNHKN